MNISKTFRTFSVASQTYANIFKNSLCFKCTHTSKTYICSNSGDNWVERSKSNELGHETCEKIELEWVNSAGHYLGNSLVNFFGYDFAFNVDLTKCQNTLDEHGISAQAFVSNLKLLWMPEQTMSWRLKLISQIGFLCPIELCLSRLEDLMELSQKELLDMKFISAVDPKCRNLLDGFEGGIFCSSSTPLKNVYYNTMSVLLKKWFNASEKSVCALQKKYKLPYRPFVSYYEVCTFITETLKIDIDKVIERPQLMDINVTNAKFLVDNNIVIGGHDPITAIVSQPFITHISSQRINEWLKLFKRHKIENFPINKYVVWVLKQDLILCGETVLEKMAIHPDWKVIRSSTLLFQLIANSGQIDQFFRRTDSNDPEGNFEVKGSKGGEEEDELQLVEENVEDSKSIDSEKICETFPNWARRKLTHKPFITGRTASSQHGRLLVNILGLPFKSLPFKRNEIANASEVAKMLTCLGFKRIQIVNAMELLTFKQELVYQELLRLNKLPNFDSYWRNHFNVLNIVLYRMRHDPRELYI